MKKLCNSVLLACHAVAIFAVAACAGDATTPSLTPSELVGPLIFEDFEDDTFVPGVTFTSSSGTTRILGTNIAIAAHSGLYGLSTNTYPDPITISFDPPARSVGLYFGNDDTCCAVSFTASWNSLAQPALWTHLLPQSLT